MELNEKAKIESAPDPVNSRGAAVRETKIEEREINELTQSRGAQTAVAPADLSDNLSEIREEVAFALNGFSGRVTNEVIGRVTVEVVLFMDRLRSYVDQEIEVEQARDNISFCTVNFDGQDFLASCAELRSALFEAIPELSEAEFNYMVQNIEPLSVVNSQFPETYIIDKGGPESLKVSREYFRKGTSVKINSYYENYPIDMKPNEVVFKILTGQNQKR